MAQYNSYHWYESLFMWITLEFLQLIHGTIYIYGTFYKPRTQNRTKMDQNRA